MSDVHVTSTYRSGTYQLRAHKPRAHKPRQIADGILWILACVLLLGGCLEGSTVSPTEEPSGQDSITPPAPSTSEEVSQLEGIDVSHFQDTVDWAAVAASGKVFGIVKATEGIDYKDPQFDVNWSALAETDMVRGAYHFFIAHDDAKTQAEFFLSTVDLQSGDLVPILDVESTNVSVGETLQGVQTWLDTVEAAVGQKPMLYTDRNFWNGLGETSSFSAYPLWIADYDVETPELPSTWTTWALWQSSQSGTVDGVDKEVDLNQFAGSLDALKAELTLTSVP